jgi:hypothetical protein
MAFLESLNAIGIESRVRLNGRELNHAALNADSVFLKDFRHFFGIASKNIVHDLRFLDGGF